MSRFAAAERRYDAAKSRVAREMTSTDIPPAPCTNNTPTPVFVPPAPASPSAAATKRSPNRVRVADWPNAGPLAPCCLAVPASALTRTGEPRGTGASSSDIWASLLPALGTVSGWCGEPVTCVPVTSEGVTADCDGGAGGFEPPLTTPAACNCVPWASVGAAGAKVLREPNLTLAPPSTSVGKPVTSRCKCKQLLMTRYRAKSGGSSSCGSVLLDCVLFRLGMCSSAGFPLSTRVDRAGCWASANVRP